MSKRPFDDIFVNIGIEHSSVQAGLVVFQTGDVIEDYNCEWYYTTS